MLTPDQINQAKATANPVTATPAGTAGMTPEQATAWITGSPPPSAQPPAQPGYLERVGADLKDKFDDTGNKVAALPAKPSLGQEVEAGLNVAKNATGAAVAPIAELPGMKQLGEFFNAVGKPISDKLMQNPTYSAAASKMAEFFDKNPGVSDALSTANNVLQLEGAKGAVEAVPAVVKAAKPIIQSAKESITPKPPTAEETAANVAATHAKAHSAIDTEVRNTAAKYPSVGKILNQSEVTNKTDPISVLSSYPEGKALPTLVKGKLQVDDATAFLKKQSGALAEIKKNLVATGKEVTPVEDFQTRANGMIDAKDGWSLAKKSAMKGDVKNIVDSWKGTYPEGIPNTELDSLKTEHTAESTSYNSKSAFSPDAHALIGQTARQLVEQNSGEAPVAELNKLIQSHYDAIKLLNSMRGKTPHGGALSRMMNNTIGEVGGLGAGLAVGHPFLGAMAGRAGAEAITEIINNHFISNPLKRSLVNNMKGTDPAVVQKALDFLDKSGTEPSNEVAAPVNEGHAADDGKNTHP